MCSGPAQTMSGGKAFQRTTVLGKKVNFVSIQFNYFIEEST